MSERLPVGPEQHEIETKVEQTPEQAPERHNETQTEKSAAELAAIQKSLEHEVKQRAVSGKEITVSEKNQATRPTYVNRELKQEALRRTLQRVQKQLHGPQKVFSKVVHQPAIQAVSDVGARTLARPSGLLGGGLLALVGSLFTLYMARHYGFRYNLTLFLVLFVGGFAVGLLLELLVRLVRRRRA